MTGTEVTAFRAEALDFLAHRVSVEADLTLSWSVQIPFRPGCTRLLAVGTQLVLFQADLGVYEVDGGPIDNGLSSWCYHALRVVEAAPSYRSEAVLVDMDGLLYRWGPGQSPRPVGRMSGPAVDTAVLGLPDDEILLQRGPHDHRELALLDCRRGELRWSLDRGSALVLPHGKSLYLEPSDQLGTVSRVDSRTGGVRWRSKSVVGGLGTFLGVVDGALWVGTRSGTVVALDVASGEPVAEVRLRTRYPDGVLDESGRLHACDGFG